MQVNLNLTPINKWFKELDKQFVISGPCSAESEGQMLAIGRALVKLKNVKIFRTGIWKPRTRPNAFEGVGVIGLKWLKKVKEDTGLITSVEVANAFHVAQAIKHGVDILWIGARTTVNPFSIQEIADALKGYDIPVMVKNPVNPDLQLWIGALERINQAGITKLGAIHRGFSPLSESKYRNDPTWKIPIELKRIIPELPIICDPSHISGNRVLIETVSQKAFDLQMDGLMIESHNNPDNALSDAKQQITPDTLSEILDRLVIRESGTKNVDYEMQLKTLRNKIDKVDADILENLSIRMQIAEEIALHKKEYNIAILQPKRYNEIMSDRLIKGKNLLLKEKFVADLYKMIHQNSIKRQEEIFNNDVITKQNTTV